MGREDKEKEDQKPMMVELFGCYLINVFDIKRIEKIEEASEISENGLKYGVRIQFFQGFPFQREFWANQEDENSIDEREEMYYELIEVLKSIGIVILNGRCKTPKG